MKEVLLKIINNTDSEATLKLIALLSSTETLKDQIKSIEGLKLNWLSTSSGYFPVISIDKLELK